MPVVPFGRPAHTARRPKPIQYAITRPAVPRGSLAQNNPNTPRRRRPRPSDTRRINNTIVNCYYLLIISVNPARRVDRQLIISPRRVYYYRWPLSPAPAAARVNSPAEFSGVFRSFSFYYFFLSFFFFLPKKVSECGLNFNKNKQKKKKVFFFFCFARENFISFSLYLFYFFFVSVVVGIRPSFPLGFRIFPSGFRVHVSSTCR